MISITEAISDLLFVRDTVVVPGLGAFVNKPCPAKVSSETNCFTMPSCQISFDARLREDNDVIIKYLINDIGISENEAKRMLFHFVSDCFNTLRSGQKVHLKDIGSLSFGPENELVFEQEQTANYNTDSFGLSDFVLEPITLEKSEKIEILEDNVETEPISSESGVSTQINESKKETLIQKEDEIHQIGKGVWVFLIGLILIMSGFYYFKVYRPYQIGGYLSTSTMSEVEDDPIDPSVAVKDMVEGMVGQIVREEMTLPSVEMVSNTVNNDTIRIIAGCYDREEYAQRMVNSLRNKGYLNAFMEKRGERWFVAFDRYHTEEEAHDALRYIREVKGDKGWILK